MVTFSTRDPLKFAVILSGAAIATCLCFYLMYALIDHELTAEAELEVDSSFVKPSLAEREPEEALPTREKPQKVLPLQPPPDPNATIFNSKARVELSAERPTFGSIADIISPRDLQLDLEAPTSDLTPLYVVQPVYPLSAAMKEIEGYVVVEFSVRENGTVSNPTVIESEPRVLFDEAALNAVSRFRFKPREVAGESIRVDNVQLKFAFNLESLYDVEVPQ